MHIINMHIYNYAIMFLDECKFLVREKKIPEYIIMIQTFLMMILTEKILMANFSTKKILMKKILMKKIRYRMSLLLYFTTFN